MNKTEVLALLKEHRNPRGIEHWKTRGAKTGLKSFGIGLTELRRLAKQIGRDPRLAGQLWKSNVYEAKVIALLIDDPGQITREQAEQQVEQLNAGMLAHVFASCDATLAKSPMAFELACDWIDSKDDVRRRCGYCLLYELSKKKNVKGMDDAYCMDRITHIRDNIDNEPTVVRCAMGGALMGIGKRNKKLNKAAIQAGTAIGPIDYGMDNCEPLDVVKHLTNDRLQKKLNA